VLGKGIWFACVRGRTVVIYFLVIVSVLLMGQKLMTRKDIPANWDYAQQIADRTVVIDAGHGGKDPGKVGIGGVLEKDITLKVALYLERLLQEAGINTVMVRTDDRDLADPNARIRKAQDLARRVELANKPGIDIFVSLHANSFPKSSVSGGQVFYYPSSQQGKILAQAIQNSFKQNLPPNRREIMPGEYYVLVQSKVPAVVVEMGFLSNPGESGLLAKPDYQEKLAKVICQGIIQYFASVSTVSERIDKPAYSPRLFAGEDTIYIFFPHSESTETSLQPEVYHLQEQEKNYTLTDKMVLAINRLLKGPDSTSGLFKVIPDGTRLNNLRVEGDTVYADFSPELKNNFSGGGGEEELVLRSILYTLGQFTEVKKVQLSIDKETDTGIGGHISLAQPFLMSDVFGGYTP
jgi:N-acetylmuramoyl-L-alanine amidase